MGVRSPVLKAFGDDFAWSLLDAAPDATLIVTASGGVVFLNDHAADLFGYDPADLLGRVVDELLPPSLRTAHRADRTRYRAEPTLRAMGAGLDLRARRCDGSEFPVEISLSPLHLDGELYVVAAVRDITARVAAEEDHRRVVRSLDASDDAVFIFDADTLRFSFVNEGAVRLVGYRRDELSTMTPLHLNPCTSEAEYRRLVAELLVDDTSSITRRSTLISRDGTELPVEETLHSVCPDHDGTRTVITVTRDITARLAADDELRRSQEALHQAERELAVAEDRERIARDLHDTVIQHLFAEGMNLQAAIAGVRDPVSTRARLESVVDGLDQTISDLRTAVFALHTPITTPTRLRSRLLAVITTAVDALATEPELQLDGPIDTIDDHIADHLIAVLTEALSNIARHAGAHHVHITVTANDHLTLNVADDGTGIPPNANGGHGLTNMATRAHDLNGNFQITPRPTRGSLLTWHVPLPT